MITDLKTDCCAIYFPLEDVLLFHPGLQAWPEELQKGLSFFLFCFCWNIFLIISFQCHTTCLCTIGNSPHLVLVTAKLVFTNELSIWILMS